MPEWSIGPHSKCGERVTVPRVRIPVFPQGGLSEVVRQPFFVFTRADGAFPEVMVTEKQESHALRE